MRHARGQVVGTRLPGSNYVPRNVPFSRARCQDEVVNAIEGFRNDMTPDEAFEWVSNLTDDEAVEWQARLPEWEIHHRPAYLVAVLVWLIVETEYRSWPTGEAEEAYARRAQLLGQVVRDELFKLKPFPDVLHAFERIAYLDRIAALRASGNRVDLEQYGDLLDRFRELLGQAIAGYAGPR